MLPLFVNFGQEIGILELNVHLRYELLTLFWTSIIGKKWKLSSNIWRDITQKKGLNNFCVLTEGRAEVNVYTFWEHGLDSPCGAEKQPFGTGCLGGVIWSGNVRAARGIQFSYWLGNGNTISSDPEILISSTCLFVPPSTSMPHGWHFLVQPWVECLQWHCAGWLGSTGEWDSLCPQRAQALVDTYWLLLS